MGKVAVVTGGNRGIGRAISEALARRGFGVALTFQKREIKAREVETKLESEGLSAESFQLSVEDRTSVQRTFDTIRDRLGPISVLVNNAALAQEKPFEQIDDSDWDHMMAVNLRGPFSCCQEALPDMLDQSWGRIVNISSIGGQWGGYNQVHYAAAKAALISLTRSLARIYSEQGITTNAVAPGLVGTEMSGKELASASGQKKVSEIPLGRIATSDEIAHAVAFLVGEEASYITGQTLNLNGGMLFR